jgi:hypothetical protein
MYVPCEENISEIFSQYAHLTFLNLFRHNLEWIVRLDGECDGCIESAQTLFTVNGVDSSNYTIPDLDTMDLPLLNSTNKTAMEEKPCFCPPPSTLTFQDTFNGMRQANSTDTVMIVTVMELENEDSCDATMLQQDVSPQQYSTPITFVVTSDPSDMSEADLQSVFDSFISVVHSHLGLTYPTCDLSRKRILNVERNPDNPTVGRYLRNPHATPGGKVRRKIQQTSADFELVANVTFTCFGCQGRLFGKTNFAPNDDCLCPIDGHQYGVDERGVLSPLNDAIAALSIVQSISDIIEIDKCLVHPLSMISQQWW